MGREGVARIIGANDNQKQSGTEQENWRKSKEFAQLQGALNNSNANCCRFLGLLQVGYLEYCWLKGN